MPNGLIGTMNPNSANQRWSKWVFVVSPGGIKRPSFAEVKLNAARFARTRFGQSSAMKVAEHCTSQGVLVLNVWEITVRSEGHPVHDPAYVNWMRCQWQSWAEKGFGPGTVVTLDAKLEAGSRQDGTPTDQMIMAEPLRIHNWPEPDR